MADPEVVDMGRGGGVNRLCAEGARSVVLQAIRLVKQAFVAGEWVPQKNFVNKFGAHFCHNFAHLCCI